MQKFKFAVGMPLVLATLMNGLVACATSASSTSAKQSCVTQEAKVGSRLSRNTCKPAASVGSEEVTATATAQ